MARNDKRFLRPYAFLSESEKNFAWAIKSAEGLTGKELSRYMSFRYYTQKPQVFAAFVYILMCKNFFVNKLTKKLTICLRLGRYLQQMLP